MNRASWSSRVAVITYISARIGTYGGFSYLAPLAATQRTLYSHFERFHFDHLDMARRVLAGLRKGHSFGWIRDRWICRTSASAAPLRTATRWRTAHGNDRTKARA